MSSILHPEQAEYRSFPLSEYQKHRQDWLIRARHENWRNYRANRDWLCRFNKTTLLQRCMNWFTRTFNMGKRR